MHDIPKGSIGHGRGCGQAPHANPLPPPPRAPVSIEELLATQNELMRVLVQNEAHRGVDHPQHHRQQDMNTSYSDFLATHLAVLSSAKDLLDVDDWLYTTESKFSLLHCTEYQKIVYAAQQLRGPVGAWWASHTATLPADHHVVWDEFHVAFLSHHLSAATVRCKLVEFLELCRGTILCMTTLRSLTTWQSMVGTMLTLMQRKLSSTARGSIFSCRTA
jgi:hypothetical protein